MKYLLACLCMLMSSACSHNFNTDYEDYGDYEGNRKIASARCEELGFLVGSPEFYACVGKEYTRAKNGR